MKNVLQIPAALFVAALLLSCTRQEEMAAAPADPQPAVRIFTCSFASDQADSKVAVSDAGKATWEVGDEIMIHGGTDGRDRLKVTLSAADISADGKRATIRVEGLDPYVSKYDYVKSGYYAQYPASAVPEGRMYYECCFNSTNHLLMAACDVEDSFVFYNLCGVISFRVSGDFDQVVFSGNRGETVAYDYYQVRVRNDTEGITVNYHKPGNGFPDYTEYQSVTGDVSADGSTVNYICLPAGTNFSAGFTLNFKKRGTYVNTVRVKSAVNVAHGKLLPLGDITAHLGPYTPPEEPELPVMGQVEWSKKLQGLGELSGLCLSKDEDFLWGVGDNGQLFKIFFDGTFESHWTYDADMEGICIDPATGNLYLGIEPKKVYRVSPPNYNSKTTLFEVEDAADMGNSGIEGIAWHKGNLYLGAQTGATLWEYKLDGTKLWKKSLRDVTSTISEIAGLDYDPVSDYLWVIDSNSNKDKPQYLPYTIYLFDGDATTLLATYSVASFADWNPESICVDRAHSCVWVADDCGDEPYSILHKIQFTNL